MMTRTETFLPDKLSDLLELALRDLAAVEADPRYKVDMTNWHAPLADACHVCLAGAVLAQTVGLAPTDALDDDMDDSVWNHLSALDTLRHGCVFEAALELGCPQSGLRDRRITPYCENPAAFRRELTELVADLREVEA